MNRILLCSVSIVLAAASTVFAGQAAPTPAPARRAPATGGQPTKQLSLALDVARGRDDNSVPDSGEPGTISPFGPLDTGTINSVNGSANFSASKSQKFISVSAQASTIDSSAVAENLSTLAGTMTVGTNLGRRMSVAAGGSVFSQPLVFSSAIDAGGAAPDTPVAAPGATQGLTSQRVLSGGPNGSATYRWTGRHSTTATAAAFRQQPQSGAGLETSSYTASIGHEWRKSRTLAFSLAYDRADTTQAVAANLDQVVKAHNAQASVRYTRRLSARRSLSLDFGAGVTRGDTLGFDGAAEFVAPSGRATGRIELYRSWSASASVTRSVTVLPGITTDPFLSTSTEVSIGGGMLKRVQLIVTGSRVAGSSRLLRANSFETNSAFARAEVGLVRGTALFVSYGLYEYRLLGAGIIAAGVPGSYLRHSFRVGLSSGLQLFGPRRR